MQMHTLRVGYTGHKTVKATITDALPTSTEPGVIVLDLKDRIRVMRTGNISKRLGVVLAHYDYKDAVVYAYSTKTARYLEICIARQFKQYKLEGRPESYIGLDCATIVRYIESRKYYRST